MMGVLNLMRLDSVIADLWAFQVLLSFSNFNLNIFI